MHQGSLVILLVASICLAFVLAALAHKLRVSALAGYLVAGVLVGPFTPGYVADQGIANQLAEIGVILLMFGVGLHFSLKDLLSVWKVAVPGALAQIAAATLLGMGAARLIGWSWGQGIVFGLSISVASTVVALRTLQERRMMETTQGHIIMGWLVVQDVAMVLALVLVPSLAGLLGGQAAGPAADGGLVKLILITLGKVGAFVALMLIVGQRVIPMILHWVAHSGSRELFRLAILALALGVAFVAATLFDVSFALGAFFAGMVLSGSTLSQQAAEESLPLRDAFAVLFFVSVGMLFNPGILLRAPGQLALTLLVIIVANGAVACLVTRLSGRSWGMALSTAASLAQIGEFSFILAGMAVALRILPPSAHDLVLAAAILSILVNPLLVALVERLRPSQEAVSAKHTEPRPPLVPTELSGHTVLIGYGRVGALVGEGLRQAGEPFLVIEDRSGPAERARADGAEILFGNAADPEVLAAANLAAARRMVVAIPQSFEAGQVVEQARKANPGLPILARSHSDAETHHLAHCGATETIMGEREIAHRMLDLIDRARPRQTEENGPPRAERSSQEG